MHAHKFREEFDRDDVSDISTETPQLWENITGIAKISNGKISENSGSTVFVRALEPTSYSGANIYRVTLIARLADLGANGLGLIFQFEDANNYLLVNLNKVGNTISVQKNFVGVLSSDIDGTGAVSPVAFDDWTDPVSLSVDFGGFPTATGIGNQFRVLVNGEAIKFTQNGVATFLLKYGNAPLMWARRAGLRLPVGVAVDTFMIEHGEAAFQYNEPRVRVESPIAEKFTAILLAGKFVPGTSHGFPADDDDRTLDSTEWEIDVETSAGWVAHTTGTVSTNPRVFLLEGLDCAEEYRARYRFVDDQAQTSDWSDYVRIAPPGGDGRYLTKPDDLVAYPLEPRYRTQSSDSVAFETMVRTSETGHEVRASFEPLGTREVRAAYEADDDDLSVIEDFFIARKGAARSFVFVDQLRRTAFIARFAEDEFTRKQREHEYYSATVELLEVL